MYVFVNTIRDKGTALKENVLKDLVSRGFDARIEEIQEEDQVAITDHDNQIRAFQYEHVALQAQLYVYQAWLQRCQD